MCFSVKYPKFSLTSNTGSLNPVTINFVSLLDRLINTDVFLKYWTILAIILWNPATLAFEGHLDLLQLGLWCKNSIYPLSASLSASFCASNHNNISIFDCVDSSYSMRYEEISGHSSQSTDIRNSRIERLICKCFCFIFTFFSRTQFWWQEFLYEAW